MCQCDAPCRHAAIKGLSSSSRASRPAGSSATSWTSAAVLVCTEDERAPTTPRAPAPRRRLESCRPPPRPRASRPTPRPSRARWWPGWRRRSPPPRAGRARRPRTASRRSRRTPASRSASCCCRCARATSGRCWRPSCAASRCPRRWRSRRPSASLSRSMPKAGAPADAAAAASSSEALPVDAALIALLQEALLSAEGDDSSHEKPRLLGPRARRRARPAAARGLDRAPLARCRQRSSSRQPTSSCATASSRASSRRSPCAPRRSSTSRAPRRQRDPHAEAAEGAAAVEPPPDPPQPRRLPQALRAASSASRASSPSLQLFQPHARREAPRAPPPVDRPRRPQGEDLQAGRRGQDPRRDPRPLHLLPPAPSKFLQPLVLVTMDLDTSLPARPPAAFWSHYRESLLPYVNRHAPEAVKYFLDRLADTRHFRMLLAYVKWPTPPPCAPSSPRTPRSSSSPPSTPRRMSAVQAAHAAAVAAAAAAGTPPPAPAPPPPVAIPPAKAVEMRVQGSCSSTLVKRCPRGSPTSPTSSQAHRLWLSPSAAAAHFEEQMPLEQIASRSCSSSASCRTAATTPPRGRWGAGRSSCSS